MTNSQNNHNNIKQKQYLPVFLSTDKSKILLVGGGAIAVAKLRLITDFASEITVIAKEIHDEIKLLAESNDFKIIEAEFALHQLGGFDIIVAATDDSKVNAEISKHAKQQNILVNVVDNSSLSNFIFGSVVKRDNLTIAISSNGISPVLTRLIKQKIEHLLPMTLGKLTNFIAKYREQVKQSLTNIQARRLFWQDVIEGKIAEEVYIGNEKKAGELLVGALSDTDDKNKAALYLIGAGPGDPDLITLKASRLIAKADVILYDRLISKELFNFARKEVIKINVGKTKSLHRYRQSEINELIKEYGVKIFSEEKIDLPVFLKGTEMQLKVWENFIESKANQKICYEDIAIAIGKNKAIRAVANAIGRNPVALLIPCHRILRKSGTIGGYRWGISLKKKLLSYEASHR